MKKKLKIKKVPKDDLKKVKGGRDLTMRDSLVAELEANHVQTPGIKINIVKNI